MNPTDSIPSLTAFIQTSSSEKVQRRTIEFTDKSHEQYVIVNYVQEKLHHLTQRTEIDVFTISRLDTKKIVHRRSTLTGLYQTPLEIFRFAIPSKSTTPIIIEVEGHRHSTNVSFATKEKQAVPLERYQPSKTDFLPTLLENPEEIDGAKFQLYVHSLFVNFYHNKVLFNPMSKIRDHHNFDHPALLQLVGGLFHLLGCKQSGLLLWRIAKNKGVAASQLSSLEALLDQIQEQTTPAQVAPPDDLDLLLYSFEQYLLKFLTKYHLLFRYRTKCKRELTELKTLSDYNQVVKDLQTKKYSKAIPFLCSATAWGSERAALTLSNYYQKGATSVADKVQSEIQNVFRTLTLARDILVKIEDPEPATQLLITKLDSELEGMQEEMLHGKKAND